MLGISPFSPEGLFVNLKTKRKVKRRIEEVLSWLLKDNSNDDDDDKRKRKAE